MRIGLRLIRMAADRADRQRDERVEAFLEGRGWPQEPLPQPHPYTPEDREDLKQELLLASWRWTPLTTAWRMWHEDADALACTTTSEDWQDEVARKGKVRAEVSYAQGGAWNAI